MSKNAQWRPWIEFGIWLVALLGGIRWASLGYTACKNWRALEREMRQLGARIEALKDPRSALMTTRVPGLAAPLEDEIAASGGLWVKGRDEAKKRDFYRLSGHPVLRWKQTLRLLHALHAPAVRSRFFLHSLTLRPALHLEDSCCIALVLVSRVSR